MGNWEEGEMYHMNVQNKHLGFLSRLNFVQAHFFGWVFVFAFKCLCVLGVAFFSFNASKNASVSTERASLHFGGEECLLNFIRFVPLSGGKHKKKSWAQDIYVEKAHRHFCIFYPTGIIDAHLFLHLIFYQSAN